MPAAAQVLDERRLQRQRRVIAGDGHRADVGRAAPATRRRRSAPSRTTEMRRAFSVSCASGVMWPPATSTIVLPYSSTRASASVTI